MNEQRQVTGISRNSCDPDPAAGAERQLRHSGYLALRRLSCNFHAGVLTLRGRVPSYYLKQVALAVVAAVEGVEHIDDQVEVALAATARRLQPARGS
jgi:osmotically-inducible protein OsmY